MPYQLIVPANVPRRIFAGVGTTNIGDLCPAPTSSGGTYDYEYEYECQATSTEFPLATKSVSSDSANMHFLKATVLEIRDAANTQINITHGATITNFNVYRIRIDNIGGARRLRFSLNGGADQTFTPSASVVGWQVGALFPFPANNRGGKFRYFKYTDNITPANNRMYDARVWESGTYLNTEVPETTANANNAIMDTGYPTNGTAYEFYSAGSPPSGTVTIGTITKTSATATVPYTYDAADQTGFEYRLNGGAAVADAASPVDLTGLTANTAYTIEVRAVNADGQGAWSAVGNFTTDAAGSVPSGTVTIGTITTTQTTASVPYTYSASDQTGFQYRLNGGTATTASASPISLTGLTVATAYTIEVRAINAAGNGSWSTSAPFTTAAAAVPSFTLTDLTSNANAPWASTTNITVDVYNPSTGALVVRKTGLTSTAGADVVVSDAALVAATTYNVFITIGTAIGAVKATAA
jgi:hypothetical protein